MDAGPDQAEFQDYWDTEFAGDLAKRRRAKFVPGEAAAKVVQTKEPSHKDDFDEWLARIICYAFSVPPQWAVKLMNRATADNQSAQAEDEGLEPTKEWVKDLIDEIIAEEFASPDLELAWLDEDEADPKGLEAVLEGRVKLGAVTLNEMRDALGLDPYANAAADRPMVLTATGYVPIEANAGAQGLGVRGHGEQCINRPLGSRRHRPVVKTYDPESAAAWPAGALRRRTVDEPRIGSNASSDGTEPSADGADAVHGNTPAERRRPANNSRHPLQTQHQHNTWIPQARTMRLAPRRVRAKTGSGDNQERTRRFGKKQISTKARAEWEAWYARVLRIDPTWKPTPSLDTSIEGQIGAYDDGVREAKEYLLGRARSSIGPGPFAGQSIPARGPERDFTDQERDEINRIGAESGCHTCGTRDPGTLSGNFVLDHQPPNALNFFNEEQDLYPQCLTCSLRQGGFIRGYLKGGR